MNETAQVARFSLVGGFTTALYFALVWLAMEAFDWSAGSAAVFAACAAIAVNFTLQRRFTFRSRSSIAETLPRYLFVQLVGAGLNAGALAVLVDHAGLPYAAGQVAGVALYVSWSFLAQKRWAFHPGSR